jgi:hypothetical protein
MNYKDGTLGEVKFVDGGANKLEKVLPAILPSLLLKPVQSQLHDWIEHFKDLSEIMINLGKHGDFTDFEIHCLERKINAWTPKWVALTGMEDMTNYTHALTIRYMIYYLKRWRNLYRLSNQGWEHLNASIRYVYHHRSQTGGSAGRQWLEELKNKTNWLLVFAQIILAHKR